MQTKLAKQYFQFTAKEKRGIFTILIIILFIFITSKYIYPLIIVDEKIDSANFEKESAMLVEKQLDTTNNYYRNYDNDNQNSTYYKKQYNNSFNGTMFYFDPNNLDTEGWKKLGIREKTIETIKNYLSKGGKFKTPEDIRKVWGLNDAEKDRLVPYINIAAQLQNSNYTTYNNKPYEKKPYEKKAIAAVDINNADSTAFDALPGIGGGFSRRIINFRNKLGGFYKIEQVAETFGLPDSVYQKIKPFLNLSSNSIRKININNATNDELKFHPYIRWQLAKVIIEYRTQHGNFKNLEDLKKIMLINNEVYDKISNYLTL